MRIGNSGSWTIPTPDLQIHRRRMRIGCETSTDGLIGHYTVKTLEPLAAFAIQPGEIDSRPSVVLAFDDRDVRVPGVQYDFNGNVFWFPRTPQSCPSRLRFLVIRQALRVGRFIIPPPPDVKELLRSHSKE